MVLTQPETLETGMASAVNRFHTTMVLTQLILNMATEQKPIHIVSIPLWFSRNKLPSRSKA